MAGVVLEVRDIYKSYSRGDENVAALRGVTLTLEAGVFATLVGPSGCGKSTLLHVCGAMDRPTTGEVLFEGCSLRSLDDGALTRLRRGRIGFVFQFFNLLPTLTVSENIGLPLLLTGQRPDSVEMLAMRWAERVGIAHRIHHFPSQLSGGEAQRAAIARAIIHEPAIVLADEPTGNLDSDAGECILSLLQEVNRELGTVLLLATHDQSVAAAADQRIRMRDGRIVEIDGSGCAAGRSLT